LRELGVTYALHRWKARGQLPIRYIIERFSL